MISKEYQEQYKKRLATRYKKNGEEKVFNKQFDKGGGHEITTGSFWSKTSSARLCFDLYSWMIRSNESAIDFEFEKKMHGINSGKNAVNTFMDVFFESNSDIYFIESKYTETSNNKEYLNKLPQAYWNTNNTYKKNGSSEDVTCSIIARYRKNEEVMNTFLKFINDINELAVKEQSYSWFDAKQETCHLIAIAFFAIFNKTTKPIHFMNIAANYEDNVFAERFRSMAEIMMNKLLMRQGVLSAFEYKLHSVRDYFSKNGYLNKNALGINVKIKDLLNKKDLYEVPVL